MADLDAIRARHASTPAADDTPPCPECAAQLSEEECPEEGEPTWWAYLCPGCGWEAYDQTERLTVEAAPWTRWSRHAQADVAALLAEVERLRAGGCARDQGTTQYCAEAVAMGAEVARLRALDDPDLDGTDHAHPAWWRGSDAGAIGVLRRWRRALGMPVDVLVGEIATALIECEEVSRG